MLQQIFLGFLGLCAGAVSAAGVVGFLIGLSIVPRYAGITRTSAHILLYEDATALGATLGNLVFLYPIPLPFGRTLLILYGLFAGIFLGGWALALEEIADTFPIIFRRARFQKGIPHMILALAIGKSVGALLFFYLGWYS
jgi:stage V sporulation protein AB